MSAGQPSVVSHWVGTDQVLPLPWLSASLTQALSQKGHALLLHGPEGVGQFELAMVMAQSVLCESLPNGAPSQAQRPSQPQLQSQARLPCGRCEACRLLASGAHPDLMVLVPEAMRERLGLQAAADEGEGGSGSSAKTKSGGRDIRVADVRRAIDWGHQTSSRGRGKVLVLHPAQALNLVAANALLKTLEEPAGQLRMVLSTADPQSLLPTLRSRCQQVALPLPAPPEALAWLKARGVEGAESLLAAAGGRPQEAWAMAQDGLDARVWPELPGAVRLGRSDLFQGLPIPRVVDALQKVCVDLMSRALGAPTVYFPHEALPGGASHQALAEWWEQLRRAARHDEHPWNAALFIEALVLQGRQCWPAREPKKSHVR